MFTDPQFFQQLLENLYDGVYFVDTDRRIIYWNKGAESISGYPARQVVGLRCRDNILNHVTANGIELCAEHCPLSATMNDGKRREAEVFLHHADGHRVPVNVRAAPIFGTDGAIIGAVETFSDNTAHIQTRRKNEQLEKTISSDPLTGVGNRRLIEARLQSELALLKNLDNSFGLLFLDIDHFKSINDTYGHNTGDKVLCMVAKTLRLNLRNDDVVGRWGGEEFVILLNNIQEKNLEAVANKLLFLVSQSRLDDNGLTIRVTVSIGATIALPEDTTETLLHRADQLMYTSKTSGRNRVTLG